MCLAGAALTLKAAINALHSASSKWFLIGVQLEVPTHVRKNIDQQFNDPMRCLNELLEYWMDNATNPPPSWRALIGALRAPTGGEKRLAGELEGTYCSQKEQGKRSKYCVLVNPTALPTWKRGGHLYDLGIMVLFLDVPQCKTIYTIGLELVNYTASKSLYYG